MKKILPLFLPALCINFAAGQGLVNNGAAIVISTGSNIYIDGATGNYTSQNGGLITNNTAGGTITLLGNWTNNSSNAGFSNDGSTVVMNGANETIGGSNSTSFYNLTLSGTGTKTLNINTTVGGISALTGILNLGTRPMDLNGNTLTITNPGVNAITYTSGYIQSETNAAFNSSIVSWNMGTSTGAHVFPFGVAGTQIPFTFNKTTAGAANIAASTRATSGTGNTPWPAASNVAAVTHMYDPALGQDGSDEAVIDRWWDISTSAAVTADLTFSYRGAENTMMPGYQTAALGAQHWSGTSWDPPVGSGTGVTAGIGTVTVTGASTFSPWIISSSLAPLPIELLYFDAICENEKVVIKWTTATETNNDHFTIERSFDGQQFQAIAMIDGSGNSTSIREYSVQDNSFASNRAYYRLKQTDFNGQFTYSPIVSTEGCRNEEAWMYAVVNENDLSIVFSSPAEENYMTILYDVAGRKVIEHMAPAAKGVNNTSFPSSSLSSGIYLLTLKSTLHTLSTKVMISK